MPSIPHELRAIRKQRGLSQHQLSQMAGIPQGHLSNLEKEKVDPRLSTLLEVARSLDLEIFLAPKSLRTYIDGLKTGNLDGPLWHLDPDEEEEE